MEWGEWLRSKRTKEALAAVIVIGAAKVGWEMSTEDAMAIAGPLLLVIASRTASDWGKEREKIRAANGRPG